MTDLINAKCDQIIKELYKFSSDLIFLGDSITDNRLELFETQIGFQLPGDFKYILRKHNGFSLAGTEVFGLDKKFRDASIDKVYHFEHEEVDNQMFKELLPFSNDGGGNHYCLDLSKLENNVCPVVFWQHDYLYADENAVESCNDNFINWIQEVMIEWTLEDINYDGTEKS